MPQFASEHFKGLITASSAFAMPDGAAALAPEIISNTAKKVMAVIGLRGEGVFQKAGSLTDIETDESEAQKDSQSADLKTTPSDIVTAMASFDMSQYTEDGEALEKTYIEDQATDSLGNVHVRNVTRSMDIDLEGILSSDFTIPIADISAPTVLIYHTHSTESYIMTDNGKYASAFATRSDDKAINMIRIGDEITRVLEAAGIGVIHDREIYDETYTGAYKKSRAAAMDYMSRYPTIQITLDIHRDAIYTDDDTRIKPVTLIEGKKAAQMMIITGAEDGDITDFPNWETNLSFAVTLQKAANDRYKSLMKPVYFCCRKYNMDLTPYSLLIEIGTDVNTLEEAAYSARLLGDVLGKYIKERGIIADK